jgi:hypothetical protein
MGGVGSAYLFVLGGCLEALAAELADGCEHAEARCAFDGLEASHEALIGKGLHPGEDVDLCAIDPTRDRLGRLEVEALDEDRQPPEEALLLRCQQVVAPGDGIAHRSEPRRLVPSPACQERKPVLEPREQGRQRQQPDLGRRQLDGQGQSVEPPADRGHRRRVLRRQREAWVDGVGAL